MSFGVRHSNVRRMCVQCMAMIKVPTPTKKLKTKTKVVTYSFPV